MAEETTGPRGGPANRVGPGRTGGLAARRRPELPQLTRRAERRGVRAAAAAARRFARRHLVDGRRALGRGTEAVGDALQGGLERFERCFIAWVEALLSSLPAAAVSDAPVVAIDGMALNLLKREKTHKGGIEAKRCRAGWDEGYMETVLARLLA